MIQRPKYNISVEETTKVKPESINFYDFIKEQLKFDAAKGGKCINAFEVICDPKTLALAYNSIRSNPGNMVEGSDKETLDGLDKM